MRRISVAPLLLLSACSAGSHHPSNAAMEQQFRSHRAEFEAMVDEIQADSELKPRFVDLRTSNTDAIKRLGISEERWAHYQQELQQLGLFGFLKYLDTVELKIDGVSFSNGDSYKGFVYAPSPPAHLKAGLDDYRISKQDEDASGWPVYKHIEGNWYLHLIALH